MTTTNEKDVISILNVLLERRKKPVYIMLVNGGSGTKSHPFGNAVFCYHLNDGQRTRFERHDVQGEVKPEYLPAWAKEKAVAIQAENANPQKNPKNKEAR